MVVGADTEPENVPDRVGPVVNAKVTVLVSNENRNLCPSTNPILGKVSVAVRPVLVTSSILDC